MDHVLNVKTNGDNPTTCLTCGSYDVWILQSK